MKKLKYIIGFLAGTTVLLNVVQNKKMKNMKKEIWDLEDEDAFVSQMSEYVFYIADKGIEHLNTYQRAFYIVQMVEMEVNNGGFSQLFYNETGDLYEEFVAAFKVIGANNMANICLKAIDCMCDKDLSDRFHRQDLLEDEGIEDMLEELDNAFLEYPDQLTELCYNYIHKYKEYFH